MKKRIVIIILLCFAGCTNRQSMDKISHPFIGTFGIEKGKLSEIVENELKKYNNLQYTSIVIDCDKTERVGSIIYEYNIKMINKSNIDIVDIFETAIKNLIYICANTTPKIRKKKSTEPKITIIEYNYFERTNGQVYLMCFNQDNNSIKILIILTEINYY